MTRDAHNDNDIFFIIEELILNKLKPCLKNSVPPHT